MARTRINLQGGTSITASTAQAVEDAVRVGNNRQGVAFVNLFQAPVSTGATLHIETSTDPVLPDASGNTYWTDAGSVAVPAVSGQVLKFTLTDLADVIRWKVTSLGTMNMTFSIVVYLTDQ